MLPSTAAACGDLSTSAPEITSDGRMSKAKSRPSSSVARMRVVESGDVVLRTEAADADILAFAAGRPVDRNARDVLQRVGDVAVREATELGRVHEVEHDRGVALDSDRLVEAAADSNDDDLLARPIGGVSIRRTAAGGLRLSLRGASGRGERGGRGTVRCCRSAVAWLCAIAAVDTDARAVARSRAVVRNVCEAMISPSAAQFENFTIFRSADRLQTKQPFCAQRTSFSFV